MGERRGLKALELWCKRVTEGYPGVKIDNMTTSWRDGLAFCAIINHFRPDLIDFAKLHKDDVLRNNELAFRVAQQYLGIPALLDAEDMVEYPVPDRLSILTYLSQFYNALACNPGNSPTRIAPKRQAPPAERSIVLPSSASPPAKMAIRSSSAPVEMPPREPCVRCALPVFLVERMLVGKRLYHAECFRCARCDQPMSAGNYYEMEMETGEAGGGYCCETCPNEERSSVSDEEKAFRTAPEHAELSAEAAAATDVSEYTMARAHFMREMLDDASAPTAATVDALNAGVDSSIDVSCSSVFAADGSVVNISDDGLSASATKDEDNRRASATAAGACADGVAVIVVSDDSVIVISDSDPAESPHRCDAPVWPRIDGDASALKTSTIEDTAPPIVSPDDVLGEETSQPGESEVIIGHLTSSNPFDEDDDGGDDDVEDLDVGNPSASSTRLDQEQKSLNPFSDDEDKEEEEEVRVERQPQPQPRLRRIVPRDSDYKASETYETPDYVKKPKPRLSLNPFSSDDDDGDGREESEESVTEQRDRPLKKVFPRLSDYKLTFGSTGDTPEGFKSLQYKRESILPTYETPDYRKRPQAPAPAQPPHISLNPFSSDEEDDTSMSSVGALPKCASFGSSVSLASTASSSLTTGGVTYRKKKQAPKPPIIPVFGAAANSTGSSPHASVTSSPSTSAQHSPRPRKAKRAPLPPPSAAPVVTPIARTSTPAGPCPTPRGDVSFASPICKSGADYEDAKVAKDEANRQTQSSGQFHLPARDKSTYGKWKRKKAQAPGLPVPQKRTIKALPMTELKKELDIIDVQLLGLSKQGVRLEKIIRDQCEGPEADPAATRIPIEAEDLILQLFEVVNEKNELCRRQSELMYLKRQHRLEEEQADIEYQVRCLMLQSCKTDTEKARETELIERLVEVVNMRAEIVECLEMDRVRGVEEDDSISHSMNTYASRRDGADPHQRSNESSPAKKGKKKKFRKLLRLKKLTGNKMDADKDVDESEAPRSSSSSKASKSKKK